MGASDVSISSKYIDWSTETVCYFFVDLMEFSGEMSRNLPLPSLQQPVSSAHAPSQVQLTLFTIFHFDQDTGKLSFSVKNRYFSIYQSIQTFS